MAFYIFLGMFYDVSPTQSLFFMSKLDFLRQQSLTRIQIRTCMDPHWLGALDPDYGISWIQMRIETNEDTKTGQTHII